MTLDQFWEIIARIHRQAGGDFDEKCALLEAQLRQLPPAEVLSFDAHFTECLDRAYTWELWAAAYIIGGGCSDDGFSDFRSTLISLGRDTFERALADPESLADTVDEGDDLQCEGFQYAAPTVARELGVEQDPAQSRPHPEEPSGKSWDEATVGELYPKLADKYGYT